MQRFFSSHCNGLRAFVSEMLNAICKVYLAFFLQKPPTSGIANAQNCKFFYNLATMPFYMWNDTLDYWICFLIWFILSLSSMSDFSTLSLSSHFVSLSLCELLSTSLSLFVSMVGPPCWWIGRFCGCCCCCCCCFCVCVCVCVWSVLKGRGEYGWSGLWVVVLLSPMLQGF